MKGSLSVPESLRLSLSKTLLWLVFITSAGLTVTGFIEMFREKAYHPSWNNLPLTFIVLSLVALVIDFLSKRLAINRLPLILIFAFAISLLAGAAWPILVVLWFGVSSHLLGLTFLSFIGSKDRGILPLLVGAGFYGTLIGFVAYFPVNYPGLYGILLALPLLWGWRKALDLIRSLKRFSAYTSRHRLLDLSIGVFALVHFLAALMPEIGHDALLMHLFVPAHLELNHIWSFDPTTYSWATMPMLGDWLFSLGYMLGGETAARLMNLGFIFILCGLIRNLVVWAGGKEPATRWAVLLFLSTPLTFLESSSLFIESIWTAFVIGGSLLVFRMIRPSNCDYEHTIPAAGLLLGFGLAAKAVSFTVLPVFFIILMSQWRSWTRLKLVRPIMLGLLLFLSFGSVPYVNSWFLTGNPVFPFFNSFFKSPFWPLETFAGFDNYTGGLQWELIYQVSFNTGKYLECKPGGAGFQWILLFLPVFLILFLARHRKGVILFLVAASTVICTFYLASYLRYVLPAFIWGSAGMGLAISFKDEGRCASRRWFVLFGCLAILLNFVFFKSGTWYGDISLKPLMSKADREEYLAERLPIRNAVDVVNGLNIRNAPVAVFSFPYTAGLRADAVYPLWYNYGFQDKLSRIKTSGALADLFLDYGIDYIISDSNWFQLDKLEMIEDISIEILRISNISVRKISDSCLFQTELIENPDCESLEGWTFPSGNEGQHPGQIIATVSSPAIQVIPISKGRRYLASVTAMCLNETTQGRVQVNWLDSDSKFMTADITVFDCIEAETTHTMEVTAPSGAAKAVIYAIGHTEIPIAIKRVSFRK